MDKELVIDKLNAVIDYVKSCNDDTIFNVEMAAEFLGCSPSNIYQLTRTDKLHKLAMKGDMFSYNELKKYKEGLKK